MRPRSALTVFTIAASIAATGPAPAGAGQVTTVQATAVAAQAAGIATMLRSATGERLTQVSTAPVCPVATPGRATCDARELVQHSGGAVLPLARALGAPGTGTTGLRSTFGNAAAVSTPGPAPYSPQFLQQAYDLGWLSASAGDGKTIAIVDAFGDPYAASDLDAYRATFGLPAISHSACTAATIAAHSGGPCMVVANQYGQTDATNLPAPADGWDIEESLDIDAVSALCPDCNILLIETNDNGDSNLAQGDAEALGLGAKLLSNSFGGPGSGDGEYYTDTLDSTGDAAGAETFAATGDSGAYAGGGYDGQTSASQAPYPASEPYVTAVGGTSLTPDASARGVHEAAWSGAGSACSLFESRPSWQSSLVTGCSGRATSDLSADADPSTGLWVYDSYAGGWGVYGGTSLAAPLTAAYVAVTGANSGSATDGAGLLSGEWAYADASQLNDITSGSNGSACTGSSAYNATQICNAGSGWDGPTGVGSISGDVLTSNAGPSLTMPPSGGVDPAQLGYSVVQSASGTSATFDGGVYPNGSPTTVWWAYGSDAVTDVGTTFSAATTTPAPQSIAAGTAPVAATPVTVSGLQEGTIDYVAQCASNNAGADTICGNSTELAVTNGPVPEGAPTLTYTSLGVGGQVSVNEPTWSPTPTSIQIQWQESPDTVTWNNVSGAWTFTIASSDSQQYLRAVITTGDSSGSTTAYSDVLQLVPPTAGGSGGSTGSTGSTGGSTTGSTGGSTGGSTSGSASSGGSSGSGTTGSPARAPLIENAPLLRGVARLGATIHVRGGRYLHASAVTISFERCAHSCVVVQSGRSSQYRLRAADAGHYLMAQIRVTGSAGAAVKAMASGLVGPVVSQRAGALRINAAHATLKSGAHTPLVNVRRTTVKSSFQARTITYLLTLSRASGVSGRVSVILCWRAGAALAACSAPVRLTSTATFSAAVRAGQSLELIASR